MNSLRAILKKERNDKFPLSGLVIHRGWLYQPGIFTVGNISLPLTHLLCLSLSPLVWHLRS